jgi:hypothetical protein
MQTTAGTETIVTACVVAKRETACAVAKRETACAVAKREKAVVGDGNVFFKSGSCAVRQLQRVECRERLKCVRW